MNAGTIKKIKATVKVLREQADRLEQLVEGKSETPISPADWRKRWIAGCQVASNGMERWETPR